MVRYDNLRKELANELKTQGLRWLRLPQLVSAALYQISEFTYTKQTFKDDIKLMMLIGSSNIF